MFTGIVEEMGTVRRVLPGARAGKITIGASKVLGGTQIGDSIAVNGVCLTVVEMGADSFVADVMPETLSKSGLGQLKTGDKVNLQRAMAADGRFGGHIVSGHIDGTGRIAEMRPDQNAVRVRISAPAGILALIVEKGSIAIDGISLTVASVSATDFQVSLIPHTGEETTLLKKRAGDIVNLENDVVGKYVQKLLGSALGKPAEQAPLQKASSGMTVEFLQKYGF
ncbi:riboflavin synthase [Slackia heliotrinireducens]|uniref:riboflavin synthase n=1 Tax=Slackia heliotrinireducens TaxID=84110 RepID=UPI003316128E